jgi:hypothetical protein
MATVSTKDVKTAKAAINGDPKEVSFGVAMYLTDKVAEALGPGQTKMSQQAREVLLAFFKDTADIIFKSYKSGKLSTSDVVTAVIAKHKNLFKAVGLDNAACTAAIAQLALVLSTQVPAVVAEANAAIVTTGIGVATGGMGLMFAAGTWTLLGLSLLSIYLSSTQTAEACSSTLSDLADSYGTSQLGAAKAPSKSYVALRCEVPVKQHTQFVLGLLNESLRKNPQVTRGLGMH